MEISGFLGMASQPTFFRRPVKSARPVWEESARHYEPAEQRSSHTKHKVTNLNVISFPQSPARSNPRSLSAKL